jgi:Flp pilus assembly protein TadD
VAILLITAIAYVPAMRGGFIWDDDHYVTDNPLLTAPDGLWRIWFSMHRQSQYFPLTFTTLRFEHMLWGLNPAGYHIVNVLMHGMNAGLIWVVLRRLALPGAWLAAAIWALHPVNVESVAWITELKNTQSTLFYLLALLAWLKFTESESARPWRFYALSFSLYALALFSKTTACTLPAAMLLVLWMRNKTIHWHRLVQLTPFLMLSLAFGLLSIFWERHLGNYQEEVGQSLNGLERLLLAAHSLWFYVAKLVWPVRLTFTYPRWEISANDSLQYVWLIGSVAVASLLWWRRTVWGRAPVAAVAFFVATLSPLLGFIPLYTFRFSYVADHYQYVASIGLIALATSAGTAVSRRAGQRGRYLERVAAAAALLILGMLTWRQAHVYQNLETLWRDTLAKNPTAWIAHNNLANTLARQGQTAEAMMHFREALRFKSDIPEAHNNLGIALASQGQTTEAIAEYREALRLKPDYPDVHFNLANAFVSHGQTAEAVAEYREALRLKPDYPDAHFNLGNALAGQGQAAEAISHFREALRLRPDFPEAHNNLGNALLRQGQIAEATAHYREALRLKPDYPQAQTNLGVAGDSDEVRTGDESPH